MILNNFLILIIQLGLYFQWKVVMIQIIKVIKNLLIKISLNNRYKSLLINIIMLTLITQIQYSIIKINLLN